MIAARSVQVPVPARISHGPVFSGAAATSSWKLLTVKVGAAGASGAAWPTPGAASPSTIRPATNPATRCPLVLAGIYAIPFTAAHETHRPSRTTAFWRSMPEIRGDVGSLAAHVTPDFRKFAND